VGSDVNEREESAETSIDRIVKEVDEIILALDEKNVPSYVSVSDRSFVRMLTLAQRVKLGLRMSVT